ncbi:MAG: hypothetical protein M1550_07470 [Deltaproteobacteria bacterium]|nr:hypothetical protein [Deltaproteobacteria bacterium]
MAVPKKIAVACFYVCSSVFTALSVYGMALYLGEAPVGESLVATALYGASVFGSLAGICYFGNEWDARKREGQKITAHAGKTPPKKPGG